MTLWIDGTDIGRLVFALWKDDVVTTPQVFFEGVVEPEGYLAAIVALVDFDMVTRIVVLDGPGSATALRASLAIANTIGFANSIPVMGVDKGEDWRSKTWDDARYAFPVYAHEPRITPRKKDALGRHKAV